MATEKQKMKIIKQGTEKSCACVRTVATPDPAFYFPEVIPPGEEIKMERSRYYAAIMDNGIWGIGTSRSAALNDAKIYLDIPHGEKMPRIETTPRGNRRPDAGTIEIREINEKFFCEIEKYGFDVKNDLYEIDDHGVVVRGKI